MYVNIQRIADFFNARFHAGIGAAVPAAIGKRVTILAKFVPAISATISDMHSHKMVLSDTDIVVDVGKQVAGALQMPPVSHSFRTAVIFVSLRPGLRFLI